MTRIPTSETAAVRATRGWTLVGTGGAADVEVTAADDAPLGEVLPLLGRELGVLLPTLYAGSTRLGDATPLTAPELAHGAVLGVGRPVPRRSAGIRSSALELHVVGGPDAGRTIPLGQGRHVLGRGREATVQLEDPDVSRRHVAVHVGGGQITVADLSSTNGSRLDGRDLDERPVSWPAGAVLRLGATAVVVAGPGGAASALAPGTGGRMRLRPSRRPATARPEVEIAFPRPPEPPPRRRPARVAVAVATWLSGRRAGRTDAAAHALELLDAQNRLADAVRAGVRAAEAAHPDLATLAGAARRRSSLLWSRSRGNADALTVRLGAGPGTRRRHQDRSGRLPPRRGRAPRAVGGRSAGHRRAGRRRTARAGGRSAARSPHPAHGAACTRGGRRRPAAGHRPPRRLGVGPVVATPR